MFPTVNKRKSFIFISSFHLGLPICISQKRNLIGWENIKSDLKRSFYTENFEIIEHFYDAETNFPLGNPLILKSKDFFESFNLIEYLKQKGIVIPDLNLENIIWVCPSGVILIAGKLSLKAESNLNLDPFEKIIEEHYYELAFEYSKLAEILIDKLLNSKKLLAPFLLSDMEVTSVLSHK